MTMGTPIATVRGVFRTQYPYITYPIVKPRTAMVVNTKSIFSSHVKSR